MQIHMFLLVIKINLDYTTHPIPMIFLIQKNQLISQDDT